MGDIGDLFRDLREDRKERRRTLRSDPRKHLPNQEQNHMETYLKGTL